VLRIAEYVSTLLPGVHGVDGVLACVARFIKHHNEGASAVCDHRQ
jgi:hypothetical protein